MVIARQNWIAFFFLLTLEPIGLWAADCHDVFAKIEIGLATKKYHTQFHEYTFDEKGNARNIELELLNSKGKAIGGFRIYRHRDGRHAEVEHYWRDQELKDTHAGTWMLTQLMKKYPGINRISAVLSEKNLVDFEKAYQSSSKEEAFKQTPFYKMCATIGFLHVKVNAQGNLLHVECTNM